MPDISKIILPTGTEYNIKDEVARTLISGGISFRGITTTTIIDKSSTLNYEIDGETIRAANGDLVIYNNKEFIFSFQDGCWHELGDNGAFGTLAYKDSATGYFQPSGTVSAPEFSGIPTDVSVSGTPSGSIQIATGNGTTNYTPEGSISKPNVNVQLNTSNGYVATSVTGGGTVVPGVAAQCTLPSLNLSVTNETLNIAWSAGSWQANQPTTVSLPTFESKVIASGVSSASLDASPTFTGTPTNLVATFSGDTLTATGSIIPNGEVSRPRFTGTTDTITVQ